MYGKDKIVIKCCKKRVVKKVVKKTTIKQYKIEEQY